jgi:imidazoleglycerol phosphate dehydratase HisB
MRTSNIDYTKLVRDTKETQITLTFEVVSPDKYYIRLEGFGDFNHHLIEDSMIILNELAEKKGIGHKLI